jgi:SAM-dependent methyltransferase
VHEWEGLAGWWLDEVVSDPAYSDDVLPLLLDTFAAPDGLVLDLGCGDGRIMRSLDRPELIGCDVSAVLLEQARVAGPVIRCELPSLGWLRSSQLSGAVAVMIFEHVENLAAFFTEASRVTAGGGTLSAVMNHPAFTASGSGPIVDQSDGEVLWRWGPYFESQSTSEPAGDTTVTFHHRPLSQLLTLAAATGWSLEFMEERALSPSTIARHASLMGQEHFPRLLGLRWTKA